MDRNVKVINVSKKKIEETITKILFSRKRNSELNTTVIEGKSEKEQLELCIDIVRQGIYSDILESLGVNIDTNFKGNIQIRVGEE